MRYPVTLLYFGIPFQMALWFFAAIGMALLSATALAGEITLKEVAPGVYVHQGVHELPDAHNRGEIANIGFIAGERCAAVIDTGGNPEQGSRLRKAIEVVSKTPICYVVNTHVHPDHIYGNLAFKQPGIHFVGHRTLAQGMAMRGPFYIEKASRELGFSLKPEHFVPPDRTVDATLDLDLGGRTLLLTAHGTAHTDNDLSVYDQKTKTLWAADLVFLDHLPVIDGSLNGWLRELEKLKRLPADLVIPGHGPVSAAWPSALEPEERYLRSLQGEVRAALKSQKTLAQAMEEVGRNLREDWRLFDEHHKRNVAKAFAELEWEDD